MKPSSRSEPSESPETSSRAKRRTNGHASQETEKIAPPLIGRRLYAIRKARSLTLCDVEKKSGLSISMLSQIERGKVNPTFSTLWQLTQSLNIDFGELLERSASGTSRTQSIEHVDAQSTPVASNPAGTCSIQMLHPTRQILPVEWYKISLAPGADVSTQPRSDGAWEHITVVQGRFTVILGESIVTLSEGETGRYATRQAHVLRNEGKRWAKAFLVVMSPFELQGSGYSHYRIT